jgi:hypothetical protein
MNAHRHHTPAALAKAMDVGPDVPGLVRRQRSMTAPRARSAHLASPLPAVPTRRIPTDPVLPDIASPASI